MGKNTPILGVYENLLYQNLMSKKFNVKRFVFSSSSSVYGDAEQVPTTEETPLNPMSPYALHKLIGEQYCTLYSELYGLETVCSTLSTVSNGAQIRSNCVLSAFAINPLYALRMQCSLLSFPLQNHHH